MTGEITLRGKVLPIGGLKEKSLAARRVGIRSVIIPQGNLKDVAELPETVRKDVKFYPVSTVDEVFALAFEKERGKKTKTSPRPRKKPREKRMPVLPENNQVDRDGVRCKTV